MNRDRSIIAVLVVLLLASLAANGWFLQRMKRPVPATAADVGGPVERAGGTRERGSSTVYELVDNPEMKGRLGRIVLSFAETDVSIQNTRTVIAKPGQDTAVKVSYGAFAEELIPGEYDLEVQGRKLAGIRVESGKDTRIASGVLRLHGSSNTRFVIYEAGQTETYLYVDYGNNAKGLPAGDYEVELGGQREKITIAPGKVTEF